MGKLATSILAGAVAGLIAGLCFATAHAILIVPIWDRMIGGLMFAVVAGAVGGWAYTELYPDQDSWSGATIRGAAFGATLWLAVLPVTLADVVLRRTGVHASHELVAVAIAVVLAVAAGAVLGWYRTKRWRGALAGSSATLLLTMAMGGPVPMANSPRAFRIFAAVLPVAIVGGAILGIAIRFSQRRGAVATHPAS